MVNKIVTPKRQMKTQPQIQAKKTRKAIGKQKSTQTTPPYHNRDLISEYKLIREHTVKLCAHLTPEDHMIQPITDASPPRWHLAHTTWFFETFILVPHEPRYKVVDPIYSFFFNSYYNAVGNRTKRNERGLLSRPTVSEILMYRKVVDQATIRFLANTKLDPTLSYSFQLGLHHEQQHQELLLTDMKLGLSLNPIFPAVNSIGENKPTGRKAQWKKIKEGLYVIGHNGPKFCFDNEKGQHKVYLYDFEVSTELVTNREFKDFIDAGGYEDPNFWHSDGWIWLQQNNRGSPLYWEKREGKWFVYTLNGLEKLEMDAPVMHTNFYEAAAYAEFRKCRLATEFEWEASCNLFKWGLAWEWTNSAYLPYPNFSKADGAIGEYNGKFMVNQMVLRGASIATPVGHSRKTYRNFWHPHIQFQFTGIRLVRGS